MFECNFSLRNATLGRDKVSSFPLLCIILSSIVLNNFFLPCTKPCWFWRLKPKMQSIFHPNIANCSAKSFTFSYQSASRAGRREINTTYINQSFHVQRFFKLSDHIWHVFCNSVYIFKCNALIRNIFSIQFPNDLIAVQ